MKEKTIFKKKNISLLYVYFLLGENSKIENFSTANNSEDWFIEFENRKKNLEKEINFFFKNGWNLEKIPVIEKTIILISGYEIFYLKKNKREAVKLINRVIEFSKNYLDKNNFRYINAILDSAAKKRFNY